MALRRAGKATAQWLHHVTHPGLIGQASLLGYGATDDAAADSR